MDVISEYWRPVAASIIPNIGGTLGALLTKNKRQNWYEHLKKPTWRPPGYIVGPVWTCLYTGMGASSYLVWRDGGGFSGDAALPLALYGTQLALNWAWAPIFFGAHKLGLATIEMGFLWGSILATAVSFYPINKTAAWLMVPYLTWVSFATCVTYWMWKNNKDRQD